MSDFEIAIGLLALAGAFFLLGRQSGISLFEKLYMPALDDARHRIQWLVDNWPEKLDDGCITFPDGETWHRSFPKPEPTPQEHAFGERFTTKND